MLRMHAGVSFIGEPDRCCCCRVPVLPAATTSGTTSSHPTRWTSGEWEPFSKQHSARPHAHELPAALINRNTKSERMCRDVLAAHRALLPRLLQQQQLQKCHDISAHYHSSPVTPAPTMHTA